MRANRCLVLSLLVLLALPVAAADATGPIADDPRVADAVTAWSIWVQEQLAVNAVPGASVGLVHGQELLLATGYGLADPSAGEPADADTVYSICSISKLFTAIAVMRLRDAGRLRLDAPLGDSLDWFAELEDAHPGDEPITLERVLTHSAGLPRESDFPYWSGPGNDFPSREQVRLRLGDQATLYPSGRYFQYSNLGLTLAGEVVAAITGKSWEAYVQREILDPLGMTDTFTSVPEAHRAGALAAGHAARRGGVVRERLGVFDVEGIAPAAGMASSARDLARFASWQLRLLGGGPAEILEPATLRAMQRVHWVDPDWETTWGLGFRVWRDEDRTLVGHSGGCPGFSTQLLLEPKVGLAAIVLTNAIDSDVRRWATAAVDLVAPAVEEARKRPDRRPARDPALDRYVGVYDSIWGREAIVRWGEGLAHLELDARDPAAALAELEKVGDHTFRRVREDDGTLGESFVFELADDGSVTGFVHHSNPMVKVR